MTHHAKAAFMVTLMLVGAPSTSARADDPPSVLVQTVMPHLGRMDLSIGAYGSAMPSMTGRMSLSLPRDGRIETVFVTQGQKVVAGAPILEWLAAANVVSAFEQAASALALARSQRQHTEALVAQQLATRDQLDQATKAVSDAQATYDALRREGGDRAHLTIAAPVDGVVSTVPVVAGDRVMANMPLAIFSPEAALVVTVGIEPNRRQDVRIGDVAHVARLDDGAAIDGRVVRVDGIVNPATRLVDVDIAVAAGSVIAGQDCRADIVTGDRAGWVIPHSAILMDDAGSYIFQVAGGHAVRVNVTQVASQADTDLVTGKLDAARPVVISGNYQAQDGDLVRLSAPSGVAP